MTHGTAALHTGVVIAAPHEGFDEHTAPIARAVALDLGAGWVVARNYRKRAAKRWFDVNRPTQRPFARGGFGKRVASPEAKTVYAEYQRRVDAASGRRPLDLLVEFHGHGRRVRVAGRVTKLQVIELATRGFSRPALVRLQERYRALVATLPAADRVPLFVEQLDPRYPYAGVEVAFKFRASKSKRDGALRATCAAQILHFELPSRARFAPKRRAAYTALFQRLLRPLVKRRGPL